MGGFLDRKSNRASVSAGTRVRMRIAARVRAASVRDKQTDKRAEEMTPRAITILTLRSRSYRAILYDSTMYARMSIPVFSSTVKAE